MNASRRLCLSAIGVAVATGLSGCGSLIPSRYPELTEKQTLRDDEILIVGRIELIPRLRPDEQKLRVGNFDPADMHGKLHQRAVLYLGASNPGVREASGQYINPLLNEWFFFVVKRDHSHITEALVYMEYEPLLYGKRQAAINSAQLLLPAPVALDVRPQDKAVYIGTWRISRDEFHQVTRASVVNDLAGARAALVRTRGSDPGLRAALPSKMDAASR